MSAPANSSRLAMASRKHLRRGRVPWTWRREAAAGPVIPRVVQGQVCFGVVGLPRQGDVTEEPVAKPVQKPTLDMTWP